MSDKQKVKKSELNGDIADHLGGYHRCFLGENGHLEFVSESLSRMLGYSKAELVEQIGNIYTALVHPDDTGIFDEFVGGLAQTEMTDSTIYRLIKKDGSVIYVNDTTASIMGNDGFMRGYSVVCELPDPNPEKGGGPGRIAVMRVAGSESALIEHTCDMSFELLGLEGSLKGRSFYDFVCMNDRATVEEAFKRSYENEYSGMETVAIVFADGTGTKCDIWIERNRDLGSPESSWYSVKLEAAEEYSEEDDSSLSFNRALFSSFAEDVFEVDRFEASVKYICQSERKPVEALLNVRMNSEDFFGWFIGQVSPKDRDRVSAFCSQMDSPKEKWSQEVLGPIKTQAEMIKGSGFGPNITIVMVPVSASKYFVCINADFTAIGAGFCSTAVVDRKRIEVRMFGSFKLTVDGEPVHIHGDKGRELLALLIEKRGAYLTTREAITSLWECEPNDTLRARYRKIVSRLTSELKSLGIDYVIESERGARRIVPEFISCDYYDFRDGVIEPSDAFLPEYPWSEFIRMY